MNKLYGLTGYPLSHSFSESYFKKKFEQEDITDCTYSPFPLEDISALPSLLEENKNLRGLNVTIPHKETVINLLDELDETAAEVGAVNTIKISTANGKILTKGFNTDVYGFEQSLKANDVKLPSSVLILGTGGASKAVQWVLRQHECRLFFATRKPGKKNHFDYTTLYQIGLKQFDLIINTTPLGMFPDTAASPYLPYETATEDQVFFDLIYNPAETTFLQKGKNAGCTTINGMMMLEQQAEKAWEIWNSPGY